MPISTADFEKLGQFYLGRPYDLDAQRPGEGPLLYDSRDLVTHAVCVGMTGSGKTGLCISLLEEAAIDGIPSIVIDPKGDLANLLLTFPGLSAAEFRPWINLDEARRRGLEPDDFAKAQADAWRQGLATWGIEPDRIGRLRATVDFAVYTPGSNAGIPVSILRSLAAPGRAIADDPELLRERIGTTATSLLGLLGIEGDPVRSREHILISTILHREWSAGRDLDLGGLIRAIQEPGLTRVGVMELETFFPAADRFQLAMALNNLLASPSFSGWLDGEPLSVERALYTPGGKPRVAIFSIAHLPDAERMFFVSLLLNETLGWVRAQSGTTTLRAIVYMDEVAGYVPPVANPPSKAPLLTLMKQARAFGVGIVLATQNPVDLDYKGLGNAGTWFLGRLQTERDKARVLDGLEGAMASSSARFDRARADAALSRLGPRQFLMNNVHDESPQVFETRWAMSYLRGPMTRAEIKALAPITPPPAALPANPPSRPAPASVPTAGRAQRPVLSAEIAQYFLPSRVSGPVAYRPMLLGWAKVYYKDPKLGVDAEEDVAMLASLGSGPVVADWDHAEIVSIGEDEVEKEPASAASYEPLPPDAGKPKSFGGWRRSFADVIYRMRMLELLMCSSINEHSKPGESEPEFRRRLALAMREERDRRVEELRRKYAPKFQTLSEQLRRARQQVEVQQAQARDAKVSTALSFGAAVLGAFLGKKKLSSGTVGKAATAARGVSRSARESADVGRAEETAEAIQARIQALESQFQADAQGAAPAGDPSAEALEPLTIKPKKTNISVRAVVLAWAPHAADASGNEVRAW